MRIKANDQIYEFPDDMPRDQIKRTLDRRFNPPKQIRQELDITPQGLRDPNTMPEIAPVAPQTGVNPQTLALPPLPAQAPQLKPMLGQERGLIHTGRDVLGGVKERFPHKAREIGSGIIQGFLEQRKENIKRRVLMQQDLYGQDQARDERMMAEVAGDQSAIDWATETGRDSREAMALIQQKATQGDPKAAFVFDILSVAGDMGLALTAGAATRNPNITLGVMGFQAGGGSYGSRRDAGEDPNEAFMGSIYTGAVESLTEKIPISRIFAKGTPFVKRMLEATVGEGLQEGASSLLQSLYDKGTIRPDMTWKEALAEAGYESTVGAVVGPIVAGPIHGVNLAQDKLAQRKQNLFVDQATSETNLPNPEELALQNLAPRAPDVRLPEVENQFAQPLQSQADTATVQNAKIDTRQKKAEKGPIPVVDKTETAPELAPEIIKRPVETKSKPKIDATKDDLMVAMSKLGGLNRAEAEAQGVDPANFTKQGGRPVFRKDGGKSFDEMAESLRGYGYTVNNPNELLDKIDASLSGERVVSQEYDYAEELEALERERYGDEINEPKKPYHQVDMFIDRRTAKVSPKQKTPTGESIEIGVPKDRPIPDNGLFAREVKNVTTGHLNTGVDRIQRAEDAAHLAAPIRKSGEETMLAMVTDSHDRVIGVIRHGLGNTDSAQVETGILLGAIHQIDGAKKVWFAHNHPSGKAQQSNADRQITGRLHSNLRGTGIENKGMIVVAPGGKASYLYTGSEDSTPINIRPERRSVKQPVQERKFRKYKALLPDEISNSQDMMNAFNEVTKGKDDEGVLFLDNRHNPVAWVPMTSKEMEQLRKGEQGVGASKLYRAIARTNAKAVGIKVNEKGLDYAQNVASFMNANEIRPLEILYGNKLASERGTISGSTTFYANPFEPITKAYQRQADKVINWVSKKIGHKFSPLGRLTSQNEYLKARNLAQGKIAKADQVAKKLGEAFNNLSPEEAQTVYRYLTTKNAKPDSITDPKIKRRAVSAKRLIDHIGRELVNRGMLSKEAYKKHKDGYLPRVYLKHLLGEAAVKDIGTGRKPSKMGYLKRRMQIPEEVRQLILGEIQDPGFLTAKATSQPLRDLALLDLLKSVSKNPEWVNQDVMVNHGGQRVSAYHLKAEADRIRAQSEHYTEANRVKALDLSQRMEARAKEAIQNIDETGDFKQIPDSPRYGALRGMWVHDEIYNDLIGIGQMMDKDSSTIESILGYGGIGTKVTQLWKMSKVALNPPTQVRNFVSNGILLHLSGVPFVRVPDHVIRAVGQIAKNGQYWRIAKKHGVTASTFAANEMIRLENDLLTLKAKQKGPLSMAQVARVMAKIGDKAGDLYQLSEGVFKTAKIMHAMKSEGMSEADAVIEANKWMYDYSLVPRSVRYLRNAPIGAPFITFYYKTLPRMMEVAVKHPVRFAPYAILPALLAEYIANLYDVDDDDIEKLKQTMPGWLKDKASAYILPYKDQHGRWQALNLEYFLPWSMFTEIGTELSKGNTGAAFKSTGLLGGPIPDLITAIKTNIDPFTQREIIKDEDPPADQVASLMTYLWGVAMPPWLTDSGFTGHMKRAVTGEVKPRSGDLPLTKAQAMLRLFGANIYPYEPEEQRRRNISYLNYELKQLARRKSSLMRNKNLTREERKDIEKTFRERMKEKRDVIKQYKQDAEVHPNLKGDVQKRKD